MPAETNTNQLVHVPWKVSPGDSPTVGSLFAGIGGFDVAFRRQGWRTVFASEWDVQAKRTYLNNFPDVPHSHTDLRDALTGTSTAVAHDRKILFSEPVDVVTAGFPCQTFSAMGKRLGFDGDRGNLFFSVLEYARQHNQQFGFYPTLLLENVRGLTTHDKGQTFATILHHLHQHGYATQWTHLNTAVHTSIPVNRERVFIIATHKELNLTGEQHLSLDGIPTYTFTKQDRLDQIRNLLDPADAVPANLYVTENTKSPRIRKLLTYPTETYRVYQIRFGGTVRENMSFVSPTILAKGGGGTLPYVATPEGIRYFTVNELFRLQGFPIDSGDYTIPGGLAYTRAQHQTGNAVCVTVAELLAGMLKSTVAAGSHSEDASVA